MWNPDALNKEQPLPAGEPGRAVEAGQDQAGDRRPDHARQRHGGHEQPDDLGALLGREPVGEIEDHAREEPRLGGAEQEADDVEADRAAHERHRGGHDPPGDHDAPDPPAGAEAREGAVGGNEGSRWRGPEVVGCGSRRVG